MVNKAPTKSILVGDGCQHKRAIPSFGYVDIVQ